jgi:sporulation protein YtfJ
MENHPIETLMRSTMENIRNMIDVNTIIGDAIDTKDGSVIIPISRVSFGFASGGSEFCSKIGDERNEKFPFGGGSGAGVSVRPVAFLVMKNDTMRLMSVDHENTLDRIVDSLPQWMETLKGMTKSKDEKCNNSDSKHRDAKFEQDSSTTSDML